jgi:hypothetical protein
MPDAALVRSAPPGMLRASWLIARKDLAIEFRTRTAFLSALVFALLAATIFFFAWDATAVAASDLAPGVLWVTSSDRSAWNRPIVRSMRCS